MVDRIVKRAPLPPLVAAELARRFLGLLAGGHGDGDSWLARYVAPVEKVGK